MWTSRGECVLFPVVSLIMISVPTLFVAWLLGMERGQIVYISVFSAIAIVGEVILNLWDHHTWGPEKKPDKP